MYKLILAFTLLLTPFFSHSSPVDEDNIFENGSVILINSEISNQELVDCIISTVTGNEFQNDISKSSCEGLARVGYQTFVTQMAIDPSKSNFSLNTRVDAPASIVGIITYTKTKYVGDPPEVSSTQRITQEINGSMFANIRNVDIKICPPALQPTFTYGYDYDNENQPASCADPSQINLVDSCNVSSGQTILNKTVTASEGCFSHSNGSSCKYNAVDVGGGNQVYQMDLEGNCYTEGGADLNGNPDSNPPPQSSNDNCTDIGNGVMACPEDPQNVCNSDGSNYGGGSINSCQSGCGEVNGVFMCYSNDTDGDSVPDYLDPDIDGDGIPNGEDLDNNGDGIDDPIDLGKPSNGGGSTTVNVDMSGLEAKVSQTNQKLDTGNQTLDDIKKSISETTVTLKQEPSQNLTGFWTSSYENGLEGVFSEKMVEIKQTQLFNFLGEITPEFTGGSAPPMTFCFNFGSGMNLGCSTLQLDPRVIPFIRIFLLIVAVFTCRKIIFGG